MAIATPFSYTPSYTHVFIFIIFFFLLYNTLYSTEYYSRKRANSTSFKTILTKYNECLKLFSMKHTTKAKLYIFSP